MILVGAAVTVAVSAYALMRGGEPERAVAAAALAVLVGSMLAQAVFGRSEAWPVIGADLCLALAVAFIAAIHLRVWLYIEGVLVLCLLVVHAVVLQSQGSHVTPLYALAVNSLNLAMLATLAVATARSGGKVAPHLTLADYAEFDDDLGDKGRSR